MKPFTQFKFAILTFMLVWGASIVVRGTLHRESLSESAFYTMKVSWSQEFDLVVAGDSRIARAVSPHRMAETLPGYRIGNLGFNANSLVHPAYLDYVADALDPQSHTRVIVLGVDPYELTPRSAEINGFVGFAAGPASGERPVEAAGWAQRVLQLSAPISLRKAAVPGVTHEHFGDRGFIATERDPIDESARLPRYRVKFDRNQVDPKLEERLFDAVESWTQRGVRVFGFWPPISPGLEQLERELSGFDQQAFAHEFTRRGGIWLSDLGSDYQTYDGEHLQLASAMRFSDALSASLAERLSDDR